jgi:molybdopterin biosynthesis enzyme MoaB
MDGFAEVFRREFENDVHAINKMEKKHTRKKKIIDKCKKMRETMIILKGGQGDFANRTSTCVEWTNLVDSL